MPLTRQQALEVIRRLTQWGSLDVLGKRLAPRSPADEPRPPDVPRPMDFSRAALAQRVEFVEAMGVEIPHLTQRAEPMDPETLHGRIEQFIGMTQIPTGLIGPIRVNGVHAHGDYYVPLATTEGTLAASYHRGARLVSRAGGVSAMVTAEQVQRAPGFVLPTLADAAVFAAWAVSHFEQFRDVAATCTSHGKLLDVHAHLEGNHVYLIFSYYTADAAGQNMVTLCTDAICKVLLAQAPVKPTQWFLEANMSGDKKATVLSFMSTRGRHVITETTLPRRLVARGLHTTPEAMAQYWKMSFVGGAATGSIGVSGHVANGIAALFTACGQDIASVSESSVGITRLEVNGDGDLHCSLTLPNLLVGTVGGGTSMPTARECLRIMRCEGSLEGKEQSAKFAEICAAVCLAGEISIVGAICAGEFAEAHLRLGRPKAP